MAGKENREAWGWLQTRERQAPTPSLSHPHTASGTGGEVSGGQRRLVCAHTGTRRRTHSSSPRPCSSEMRCTGASADEHPAPVSAGSRAKVTACGGGGSPRGQSLTAGSETQRAPHVQTHRAGQTHEGRSC